MKRSLIPNVLLAAKDDGSGGQTLIMGKDGGGLGTIISPAVEIEAPKPEDTTEADKRQAADEKRFAELTPEQLEADRLEFLQRMGFAEKPKPKSKEETANIEAAAKEKADKEKADADTAAAAKVKADEEAAAKAKADKEKEKQPKPAKKKSPAAAAAIDPEALQTAIIEGTKTAVQAIADKLPGTANPPAAPTIELEPRDKKILSVLKELETDPKYAGIADQTLKFWEKEAAYKGEWAKANPGKEFSPADEEHQTFYGENEPMFDESEYEAANERLIENRARKAAVEEVRKQQEPEMLRMKIQIEYEKAIPQIIASASAAKLDFVAAAVPEFAKLMTVDGKLQLTDAIVARMDGVDKDLVDFLEVPSQRLQAVVAEIEKVGRFAHYGKEGYRIKPDTQIKLSDGEVVYPHREILDVCRRVEAEYAADPESAVQDGKEFMPEAKYEETLKTIRTGSGTAEAKKSATDRVNAQFWTLGTEQVRAAYIADQAAKMSKLLTKLGRQPKDGASTTAQTPAAAVTTAPVTPAAPMTPVSGLATKPPSTADSSDKTIIGSKPLPAGAISDDNFNKRMGWD